jgi:hypothetical protein
MNAGETNGSGYGVDLISRCGKQIQRDVEADEGKVPHRTASDFPKA